jgi:hypothetical protein
MRLTLRTLLAWLDDTLPAAQVREIGKQVDESSYAQELVERIHRVTRQRRLTVPSRTGPDAIDPNIVASYVDNHLDPEQVAEYEKKCLTSDVNLAEVASVHQILSLLGQKVHVPGEAKTRMYQLIKGRESIPPPRRDSVSPAAAEPVTKPIKPWVAPGPPRQSWLERYGPIATCVALIALLSWSAYRSLTPTTPVGATFVSPVRHKHDDLGPPPPIDFASGPSTPNPASPNLEAPNPATPKAEQPGFAASNPSAVGPPPAAGASKEPLVAPGDTSRAATTGLESAAPRSADSTSKPKTVVPASRAAQAVPADAAGVVDKCDGFLLRYSNDKREWERVGDGTALGAGDRLLCLAPFRARIVVANTPATLLGEAHVRLAGKKPSECILELIGGRVRIDGSASPGSFKVAYTSQTVGIDWTSPSTFGLERASQWHYGQPPAQPAELAVHASEGELKLTLNQLTETLAGPGAMLADGGGRFQPRTEKNSPGWLTELEIPEKDRKLIEQFLQQFSPDRPVLMDIVVATESDSPVNKKSAIFAVKALGELSLLTPILSRGNDPLARQSTISALRALLAEGLQSEKRVGEALAGEFGEQTGRLVEKLLIGFTPEEAPKKETVERLIELLSPKNESLAVRELALDNLKSITGRDNQGYDPDRPDEKGLAGWKSLLTPGELKAVAKRKPAG